MTSPQNVDLMRNQRDQLIEHVANSSIRERLLLEPDLTLDKDLSIATQLGSAIQQAKGIAANDSVPVHVVQPSPQTTKKKYKQRTCPNAPSNAIATSSRSCFRCGSDKHLANSPQCPAAKATCKSCHKVGHFAHVCCSAKTSNVGEIQLLKLTVLYLKDPYHAPETLKCKINIDIPAPSSNEHKLVVNMGSGVSILPRHLYKQYLSDIPLLPPTRRLVTYTRKKIPVLGCLQDKGSLKKLKHHPGFYPL